MYRLGIIGCGITGSITAMLLKQRLPQLNVTILEKSKGTGGRMCTSRSELGSSVDLGAQFITKTSNLSSTQEKCYTQLIEAGLLEPLQETIEGLKSVPSTTAHFTCPKGSGSLVKHFLHLADCKVLFGKKVRKITSSSNIWQMLCDDGSSHEFDAVVLTLPVPQILELDGIKPILKSGQLENLKAVDFCSRFALGLFYDENSDFFKTNSWKAKFITDDIVRYCSLNHTKRNVNGLPTVAIHTTKEFGKANIDNDPAVVQTIIVQRIQQLCPQLPSPAYIKFHKWRYSQVENSYVEPHGCLVVAENPILICGGDGFSSSNFENCVFSAESIVEKFINCMNENK